MLSAGKDVNEELPPLPPRENIVKTVSTVEAMDPLDGRVERSNTESDGTDLSVLWTDACTTVPTTEPVNIEAQLIAAINDFNHKNRYVAHLPIQSDDQLRQCAYEDLLLFVHQLKRDEGDSGAEQPAITKLTEYIDETLRLQMNISVKKYQRSKQIAAAL
jgi:hypothetical protein